MSKTPASGDLYYTPLGARECCNLYSILWWVHSVLEIIQNRYSNRILHLTQYSINYVHLYISIRYMYITYLCNYKNILFFLSTTLNINRHTWSCVYSALVFYFLKSFLTDEAELRMGVQKLLSMPWLRKDICLLFYLPFILWCCHVTPCP